jgi:lysophospholipase L1-like esterase
MTSPDGLPIGITYGSATATGGAPPVSVSCTPANGSLFSVGSTTVTCTATDARQRTDACSFAVVVLPPPKILYTRFVSFGDSITWGEDGQSSLAFGLTGQIRPAFQLPLLETYPGALQATLRARYTTQTPVVTNQGAPGEEASLPATPMRFSQVLSAGYDVVLLMEGSNDVDARDSRVEDAALANLGAMLRDAQSRGVRPYLATIPPMVPGLQRSLGAALVPGFNDQIRALAASAGVTLVDVYNALNTAPTQYIGFDGLHPNADGYAKIADTFFTALRATLEVAQPVPTGLRVLSPTRRATPPRGSPGSPVPRRR